MAILLHALNSVRGGGWLRSSCAPAHFQCKLLSHDGFEDCQRNANLRPLPPQRNERIAITTTVPTKATGKTRRAPTWKRIARSSPFSLRMTWIAETVNIAARTNEKDVKV